MPTSAQLTITLPEDLVRDLERRDDDRDQFVADAVRRELDRRRREDLEFSLENPHPESTALAGQDVKDWLEQIPEEDIQSLFDPSQGKAIRWLPGEGWIEDRD